jgi:hypothetical protein
MACLIASLALMGTLVASQPPQEIAPMGRVSGTVIEDGTSAPVAGVRVFVLFDNERSAPSGSPPATVTDPDGRFRFDFLPAGRYHIAAQKAGYAVVPGGRALAARPARMALYLVNARVPAPNPAVTPVALKLMYPRARGPHDISRYCLFGGSGGRRRRDRMFSRHRSDDA